MRTRYCILTNDVETTSIINHNFTEAAGTLVLKEGMPRLIELYKKYNVKATFFYNGDILRQHPEVVKIVKRDGHEIASHGWTHLVDEAFDVLSYEEQCDQLKLTKQALEKIGGEKVYSFRAPALRVNEDTTRALADTGHVIDSSISPQRMDMFLSFGGLKKLHWLFAPRNPYQTSQDQLWRKGKGSIFEIPVSAFGLPYIGTTLRITPFFTRITRMILHLEASITGKPIVFLTHPNEFIDESISTSKIPRRSKNYISYLLGDLLRRKLKLKNLGVKALPLYEREIKFFKNKGYRFVTCYEYYQIQNET